MTVWILSEAQVHNQKHASVKVQNYSFKLYALKVEVTWQKNKNKRKEIVV